MATFKTEHTFNCSEDTYWDEVFPDEEFNRRLFMDELGFTAYEVKVFEDTPKGKRRVIEATPDLGEMPGPMKKLVGDGVGYREESELDRESKRMQVKVIPSKLADKIKMEGVFFTRSAGEGKCTRVFEMDVNVKIFGVGGMVEKKILDDLAQSYDKAAKFTNAYLEEKGLS